MMDGYSMRRVFRDTSGEAQPANGQVRFYIAREVEVFLSNTFDGKTAHYELGELARAHERHFAWENNFGFEIIRVADGPGFSLRRLADDQIEGHPCHFIEATDRAGRKTTFGIDRGDYQIRSVSFDTEVGFHRRIYPDFRWAGEGKSFLQPHRVRIYFDGTKWFDIDWLSVEVDRPIPDAVFAANG